MKTQPMLLASQSSRRKLLLLTALSASIGAWPSNGEASVDDAAAPVPIRFPDDEGVHADATTEWWYYTGHLTTDDGRLFGFEHVFFRAARGQLRGWAAHFAVTDGGTETFSYNQRSAIGDGDIIQSDVGMDFRFGDWSIRGIDGLDYLSATTDDYAIQLDLTSEKPPVLHGADGFTSNGSDAQSYYYSRTRYAVEGQLVTGGVTEMVRGTAWMDHQWGSFTSFSDGGWDWFALQLDDRSEVMVYALRDETERVSIPVATYIRPDGVANEIAGADVELDVLDTWKSESSGATYPARWQLRIPAIPLDVTIEPVLRDQELDTRATTGLTYWEGQARVAGRGGDAAIAGLAYVELTGYTRERDGRVP